MSAEYLILMRLAQLMLGSMIGCLCIYFGYKLFSQIPVNVTNDGQFKMPKIGEAKLKVAPGIFFAILGTAIVYFSIERLINIKAAPTVSNARGIEYSNDLFGPKGAVSRIFPPQTEREVSDRRPPPGIEYDCRSGSGFCPSK